MIAPLISGFVGALLCAVMLGVSMVYRPVQEPAQVKRRIIIAMVAIVSVSAFAGWLDAHTLKGFGAGFLGGTPLLILGCADLLAYALSTE
jgi:hypothetical protein